MVSETFEMCSTPYREATETLLWSVTMTRPDVSFATHKLAKCSNNPGSGHWRAASTVIRYLSK